jgi:hypothetical protein
MGKTILSVLLAIFLALNVTLFCQGTGISGVNPEVESREKLLLQGLSPVHLQAIRHSASLFEGLADTTEDPASSLDRIFNEAGIAGMDVSEAAFLVLAMATTDMDDDIRTIMAEIKAMTGAKQKMRELLQELNNWISGKMSEMSSAQSEDIANKSLKTASGGEKSAPGTAAAGQAGTGAGMAAQLALTTHYRLEYWKAVPVTFRSLDGMSRKERLAEAELLKARLAELDGLLAWMTERFENAKLRRLRFAHELDGLVQKMPHPKPERE